ncbi:alpha/beta fold hydrolase [Micromonospora polyrhachis]|uniref:Pimeloyl-ACP methyl ester carboxylesterase n=1 Tax=Micromonospora polyrhachis TaxID=1282883 RepID=A0A7W7WSF7_9ACTN|nr:alpha/beta fold hydrolase [Micromonospora polyrhachis]MBB4962075.1 pimeloyl-ACP methyl ester carboxylesterase [Micromonospora polyrhachis]
MVGEVRVRGGGDGEPLLLLVHGLGATAEVWDRWRPVLTRHWPGRWLAPDLPGHGGSAPLARYSFDSLAEALARLVEPGVPVVVLGHSLGGVLGLTLAGTDFNLSVAAVVGLGIKVSWTGEELAKARALADRPVTFFDSRQEAALRQLRVSGLVGLLDPDDEAVSAGLRQEDGRWRLALDPAVFGVGAPDMPTLLAAARAPVVLARGGADPMVSAEQLRTLSPSAVTLPGLGHNAHVEDPGAVFELLRPYRAGRSG